MPEEVHIGVAYHRDQRIADLYATLVPESLLRVLPFVALDGHVNARTAMREVQLRAALPGGFRGALATAHAYCAEQGLDLRLSAQAGALLTGARLTGGGAMVT